MFQVVTAVTSGAVTVLMVSSFLTQMLVVVAKYAKNYPPPE
jgi:hypothetical protein